MDEKKHNLPITVLTVLLVFLAVLIVVREEGITGRATGFSGNLSVNVTTAISCTWSNAALDVYFGEDLIPGVSAGVNGTRNHNFTNNLSWVPEELLGTDYNVTNHASSTATINVSIKGDHLWDTGFVSMIVISNISWASNWTIVNASSMIYANGNPLETWYNNDTRLAENLSISNSSWYRFWLDVPASTPAGIYTGNYTVLCEEAGL